MLLGINAFQCTLLKLRIIADVRMEKGVQVCVKFGKTLKKSCLCQADLSCFDKKEAETQCSVEKSSYSKSDKLSKWIYDR